MKINVFGIANILGVLLFINALLMMLCIPVSLYYRDGSLLAVVAAVLVNAAFGLLLWGSTRRSELRKNIKKRDGYITVTLGWFFLALFGTLPFLFSGAIPDITNAFFETTSGYTTTGATILNNIEALPQSILFWRSLTQWIGGLGFVVLALTILPILGVGGMQLYVAEAPGITPDKLKPRIKETAKRLWFIYIGLTLLETIMLKFGGMSFFDAINHSLTTMSTGGFSTRQASIGYYSSPFIEYTITFFCFLGGTSFVLIYFVLKGRVRKLITNEEFRWYVILIFGATAVITAVLMTNNGFGLERAFRESIFQVVNVMSTTGYATADFTHWGAGISLIFLLLMMIGGMAGSTAGGVKVGRHIIIAKNSILEFKRQLHPSAIIPVRLNNKPVGYEITRNILAFIIIYLTIFGFSSVVLSLLGMDALTAIGSVATSLGNVGPGLNETGPSFTFSEIPSYAKWWLSCLMIIGRLEIFTVMILFSGYFWRYV